MNELMSFIEKAERKNNSVENKSNLAFLKFCDNELWKIFADFDISKEFDRLKKIKFFENILKNISNIISLEKLNFLENPNIKYICLVLDKNFKIVEKILDKLDLEINIIDLILQFKDLNNTKLLKINKEKMMFFGYIFNFVEEENFLEFFEKNDEMEIINKFVNKNTIEEKKEMISLAKNFKNRIKEKLNINDITAISYYLTNKDDRYVNNQQKVIADKILEEFQSEGFDIFIKYLSNDIFYIDDYIKNEDFLDKVIKVGVNFLHFYNAASKLHEFNLNLFQNFNIYFQIALHLIDNHLNNNNNLINLEGENISLFHITEINSVETFSDLLREMMQPSLNRDGTVNSTKEIISQIFLELINFNRNSRYLIFSKKENKIVGYIRIYKIDNDFSDDLHLGIYIFTEHRKKGYMNGALKLLFENFKEDLVAYVNIQNEPAKRLLENSGFLVEEECLLFHESLQVKLVKKNHS